MASRQEHSPGLSESWSIVDSGHLQQALLKQGEQATFSLQCQSNNIGDKSPKKHANDRNNWRRTKHETRNRSNTDDVTCAGKSTFYTRHYYEPSRPKDDSSLHLQYNNRMAYLNNDISEESVDSLYNEENTPTSTNQNTDDELLLDPSNIDSYQYFGTLREIPQRRDYSLPLDLTYDGHNDTRSSPKSPHTNHKKTRSAGSWSTNSLFSRFRRGSGSLNDVSDESDKHRNTFDFGTDLDLLEQGEKVKTKLISVWNNVKYGWMIKTKTYFKYDSQVFILGRSYHIKKEEEEQEYAVTRNPLELTAMERFKRDFTSRIWFTYRRDLSPLPLSTLTTDCGWGCMLRCGQMIIAQGLIDHFLGRDWRVYDYQLKEEITLHHQIIRWFGDYPSSHCPFSLHSLIMCGQFTGKKPGDWYGPSSVAHILKYALLQGCSNLPILKNIAIYVAQDCTVYLSDIVTIATQDLVSSYSFTGSSTSTSSDNDEWKRGVIILIPVRLGGEALNPLYIPCIKASLAQDNCIGIIGGKPRHSMYFIGWQEDKLIYLDPHYCQDIVDVKERDFRFESFHCMSPRKIAISKIDPSCTIGFYCRTQIELQHFITHTQEMVSGPKMRGMYPMFVISKGKSEDVPTENLTSSIDILARRLHQSNRSSRHQSESEEFVFL